MAITPVYLEGFDDGLVAGLGDSWSWLGGLITTPAATYFTTTPGRTGTAIRLRSDNQYPHAYDRNSGIVRGIAGLLGGQTRYVVGVAFRQSALVSRGSGAIPNLYLAATTGALGLSLSDTGLWVLRAGGAENSTLLATSAQTFPAATWMAVRMLVTEGAAGSGRCQVWVDGTKVIDVACTITGTQSLYLAPTLQTSQPWCDFDDLWVGTSTSDADVPGDYRVHWLLPNDNGASSQGTGSDGNSTNNYLLTNKVPVTIPWASNGTNGLIANARTTGVGVPTATASSSYAGVPGGLVDGNLAVGFHSSNGLQPGEWWKLDFGNRVIFPTRIGMYGQVGGRQPRNFNIDGSNDNTNWTTLLVVTGEGPAGAAWWSKDIPAPSTRYRYLRMIYTGVADDGSYYFNLLEVEVWGTLSSFVDLGSGEKDSYALANLPFTAGEVLAVQPRVVAERTESGTLSAGAVLRLGATEFVTARKTPAFGSLSYLNFPVLTSKPGGGLWSAQTVNQAELGIDCGEPIAHVGYHTDFDGYAGFGQSFAYPAHLAGDRLVAIATLGYFGSSMTTPSAINGQVWNLRYSGGNEYVWEMIATEARSAGTCSTTFNNSCYFRCTVARITGSHATEAMAVSTASSGSSTAPDSPSLSPPWGATSPTLWGTMFRGASNSSATLTYPAGFDKGQKRWAGGGTDARSMGIAWRYTEAQAALDPDAFTLSGSESWGSAVTLAIRGA